MSFLKQFFLLLVRSIVASAALAQSYPVASVTFSGDTSFSQTELLEVKDLDPQLQALVLKSWKLDTGAPYDASYVQQFLKRNKDLHALDGYSGSYKQYEHEDTHVVDLVVSFRKGGPLS